MKSLRDWPGYLRGLAISFVFVSLVGYAAGLAFIYHNSGMTASGLADHYHGNEPEMKFGKSPAEMLEIVHTHLLGMGLLFLATGALFAFTDSTPRVKGILMTETMLSLLTTFGGLWLISFGQSVWVWVVFPSSILMIVGYFTMSVIVLWNGFTPRRTESPA